MSGDKSEIKCTGKSDLIMSDLQKQKANTGEELYKILKRIPFFKIMNSIIIVSLLFHYSWTEHKQEESIVYQQCYLQTQRCFNWRGARGAKGLKLSNEVIVMSNGLPHRCWLTSTRLLSIVIHLWSKALKE